MTTAELGKEVQPATKTEPLHWNFGDTLLPRQFGLMCSDLGFSKGEIPSIIANAGAGNAEAKEKYNLALNAYLELCARDTCTINRSNPHLSDPKCFKRNARGERLHWNEHGDQVPQRYSSTLKDDSGGPLEYQPVLEVRTRRGVRPGHETVSAPGTPLPTAGHFKRKVEEHFDDLFPRLVWLEEYPDDLTETYNPKAGGLEAAKAAHAATLNNKNPRRKALLEWLTPFKKKPVSDWNGED